MVNTSYFPFYWELTGCRITRSVETQHPNYPADMTTTIETIYDDVKYSRIVDITNSKTNVDEHDKQRNEQYCLYLDRIMVGLIEEGDKVEWLRSQMGMSLAFVDAPVKDKIVGKIHRLVAPQNGSSIGSLECYISTNN